MRSITQPSTYENKERRLLTQCESLLKRLERGVFSWPQDIEEGRQKLILKPTALAMLTDGIDLRDGLQRPWYEVR